MCMRRLSLRLLLLAVGTLPQRPRAWTVRTLARLRYRHYYRGIRPLARNIRERLGVSEERAEEILVRGFELHLMAILDGSRASALRRAWPRTKVEFRGLDRLDDALKRGRGAVITTAHCEGLLTGLAALAPQGYPVNAVPVWEASRSAVR